MVVKAGRMPSNAGRYLKYLGAEASDIDPTFAFRLYGEGAKRLGLHGREVSLAALRNLARGLTEDGSVRLGRRHRYGRWGTELLMHLPSAVSKAAEVLDDRRYALLLKAVEKSAHAVMRYVERHAAKTRVVEKGVARREPVGLAYAVPVHGKNRDGESGIHVHGVVFNVGVRANGAWAKIENRHIYNVQKAARRVFNQALAYHITRDVGLKVVCRGESVRVKGVDREWAKTTRSEGIKREQKRSGRAGPKGATSATFKTRKPKEAVPFAEVRRRWREAAHTTGRFAADLARRVWTGCTEAVHQRRADRCYRLAATAVAATVTRFPARKVDEAAAFLATARNVPPEALARAAQSFRDSPKRFGAAVTGAEFGQAVYTSARHRRRQERVVADLVALAGRKRCGLSDRKIAAALAGGGARAADMAEVRRLVARSGAVVGESHAAAGPALARAVTAYRHSGRTVIAVAAAAPAAADLRRRLGVRTHTASELAERLVPPSHMRCLAAGVLRGRGSLVQRLGVAERMRKSNLRLPRKCVVVVDAGLDHAAELHTILKAVRRAGGKLIVTGPHSAGLRERMNEHDRSRTARPDGDDQSHTRSRGRSR